MTSCSGDSGRSRLSGNFNLSQSTNLGLSCTQGDGGLVLEPVCNLFKPYKNKKSNIGEP